MQRATWTDERLDDLNHRVDNGFNQVNAELRELRREVNARFEATDAQFAALHRLILKVGGGGIATLIVGFVGLVVAHA